MQPHEYDDFVLEMTDLQENGRFRVRVLDSAVGGMTYKSSPTVQCDWDVLTENVKAWDDRPLSAEQLVALGRQLADLLLPEGPVRTMYWRSRDQADSRKRGLRLRLRFEDTQLAALPWELMNLDRGWGTPLAADFFALQRATSITRHDAVSAPVDPLSPMPQIRLLGVLAEPTQFSGLALEKEKAGIEHAIAVMNQAAQDDPAIVARWLEQPTRRSLDDIYDAADIFHFAGYGGNDDADNRDLFGLDRYFIVVLNSDGGAEEYSLTQLAPTLASAGSRLVLLNAGNVGPEALQVFARAGIPSAVGEHGMPLDTSAVQFAAVLYSYLTLGASIDEAVSRGRQAIYTSQGLDAAEWGRFILQLQAPTGFLFSAKIEGEDEEIAPPLIRVRRHFGTVDGRTTGADIGDLAGLVHAFPDLDRTLIEIDERTEHVESRGESSGIRIVTRELDDSSATQTIAKPTSHDADAKCSAGQREPLNMTANDSGTPEPTPPRRYHDLSLELRNFDPASDTYDVALLPAPEFGEPPAARLRLAAAELQDDLDDLDDKRIGLDALIRLGEGLANRLLPDGPIREHVVAAVKTCGQDDGMRLRLLIRAPRLAQLPWEYCYLPIRQGAPGRAHFLVLDPQVSLVRHVPLDQPQPPLAPREEGELRLVAAFASPADMDELTLRRERRAIEAALAQAAASGIQLTLATFLDEATPEDLTAALQRKADLFHFAGHGGFLEQGVDPTTGEPTGAGCIVLVRDRATRRSSPFGATDLALRLQGAGVRMAVLGACESGRHDGISPWDGVAPALVGRGLPAVVAMQYEIEDGAATAFSGGLYAALAAGLSIDEAVYSGRLAVLSRSGDDDIEWGVPVLYLRAGDGVIFPGRADQPSGVAEQLRSIVRQNVRLVQAGGVVTGIDIAHLDLSLEGLSGALGNVEVDQQADTVAGEMTGIRIGETPKRQDP